MPLAGDAYLTGQLPQSHNPLARVGFNTFKVEIDPVKLLQQVVDFFETYGLQAIESITGIDLTALQAILDGLKGFLNLSNWADLSNLPAAVLGFISSVLQPTGLLVGSSDVLGSGGIPNTVPFEVTTPSPTEPWFAFLRQFLNFNAADPTLGMNTALQSFLAQALQEVNVIASGLGTPNIITSLLDGFFTGLTNLTGTGHTSTQVVNAVTAQTNTVVNQSAAINQILTGLGAGSDIDDFERTSTTDLGPNWDLYYSFPGITWATPNGHDASWAGANSGEFIARRNTMLAATDNHSVEVVLGSALTGGIFPLPTTGYTDLWVRLGTFTTFAAATGVRLRFGGDGSVKLSCFNSGTETAFSTGTVSPIPSAGTRLSLAVSGRVFACHMNDTAVLPDYTDTTVSQLGATFRGRGHGGRGEFVFPALASAPSLNQWSGQG